MTKYLLGIDNGGTMTKAAIFDMQGNEIAVSSVKTPIIVPQKDYAERDMMDLWDANISVIKNAIAKSQINPENIIAVGCTGHGKGLYLWGKDDKPVRNAIASTDNRAASYIEKWREDKTSEKAYEKIMQYPISCQPVALLAWLKDNNRKDYDNIKWVFEAKDFTRFMLTNEAFAEATDYSGTGLMNLKTCEFDQEILDLFGIGEIMDKLPPIRRSIDVCGFITPEVSSITGLKAGTIVCGGMFDIDACAIAMDVSDEEKLCVITGTWSINEYISKVPVRGAKTTLNSLFCLPGFYLIEESSPTSAGNLEWFIELLNSKSSVPLTYEQIEDQVDSVTFDDCDVLFIPFLYGTNSSKLNSASFLGLKSHHNSAHMLRAIFEGVAFSHKIHIDRLLLNRESPQAIRFAGGVVNSKAWVQIFADILGISIEVVDVKELGTLGCSIAAAIAAGEYKDYKEAASAMVKVSNIVKPDAENSSKYNRKFEMYKKALSILEEL